MNLFLSACLPDWIWSVSSGLTPTPTCQVRGGQLLTCQEGRRYFPLCIDQCRHMYNYVSRAQWGLSGCESVIAFADPASIFSN